MAGEAQRWIEASRKQTCAQRVRMIFKKIKILHKREDENECAVSTPANSCPLHSAKKFRQKMALPFFLNDIADFF